MKKLERKISVIIPVYNAEKTIDLCLESIIKQEYLNKEIVIVDNESTDKSLSIIMKYVKKYDFIKVYKSKSYLAGGVKNLGIKKCSGDYFVIIDADDYVNKQFLNRINDVILKHDYSLVRFNASYNDETNSDMFKTTIKPNVYDSDDYLKMVIEEYTKYNKIFGPSWLYAYNRKFFIENNFKFKNRFQEDYGLTPKIIINAKKICVISDIIYNYVYNCHGMTNNKNNTLKKAIDVIYYSELHLKNLKNVNENVREKFINYICETLLRKYKKLDNNQRKIFVEYIERSDCIGKYFDIGNNTGV